MEKSYRASNGPRAIDYKILEVGGSPVRIPKGYVERTKYCPVAGIDAVAFTVRGDPPAPGVYILQLDGSKQIFERICDYGVFGHWDGARFKGCNSWDAHTRRLVGHATK